MGFCLNLWFKRVKNSGAWGEIETIGVVLKYNMAVRFRLFL